MNQTIDSLSSAIHHRAFQGASLLVFNSFSWYFPLFVLFSDTLNSLSLPYSTLISIFGLHYGSVAVSAFLGNYLSEKIGRNKLLSAWIILGVISSILLLTLSHASIEIISIISILLGVSLGLGFPSCLEYLGDSISANRKGLIGGFIFALTFVAIMTLGFFSFTIGFAASILLFTGWRLLGLVLFLTLKTPNNLSQMKITYSKILQEKTIILYLLPWSIFCIINFIQVPVFDSQLQQRWGFGTTDLSYIISLGEFGIGAVSMIVSGYLSDKIGRKRLIIAAFAMVGVGYTLLSFAYQNLFVFYCYVVLDGIAWGIFFLMFLLVVWGDLLT